MKYHLVVRETKGTNRVVLCEPKAYVATGAARISRLQCRSMVDHLSQTQNATGSSPVIKKAKSAPATYEKHLMLDSQENQA